MQQCVLCCRCRPTVVAGSQERERLASVGGPRVTAPSAPAVGSRGQRRFLFAALAGTGCWSDSRRPPIALADRVVPLSAQSPGQSFSRPLSTHSKISLLRFSLQADLWVDLHFFSTLSHIITPVITKPRGKETFFVLARISLLQKWTTKHTYYFS